MKKLKGLNSKFEVAFGTLILLFSGAIYAWSIFIRPLEMEFGFTRSQISLTFSLCMTFFSIGGLSTGILIKKKSKTFLLNLAAIIIVLGFVGASRLNTLIELYLFYGVLTGFAVGILYNLIVSTTIKKYPGKEGFVSGILLMGFGFGGMVMGQILGFIIDNFNWRIALLTIGIAFGIMVFLYSLLTMSPKMGEEVSCDLDENGINRNMSAQEVIRSKSFYLIFIWLMLHVATGLAIIGHAAPIANSIGISETSTTMFVGLISVANGLGRILTGLIYDKIGSSKTMKIISTCFIISGLMLIMSFKLSSIILLIAGFLFAGYAYGSIAPTQSAITNEYYGPLNYSINFGMVSSNGIIASFLGPYMASLLLTMSGTYIVTFISMIMLCTMGLTITLFLKKPRV